jgi:hypothetical protein
MLIDSQTVFYPKGTSLVGLTGAANASPNIVSLEAAGAIGGTNGRDVGNGKPLYLACTLNGVAAGAGTTLQIDIQGAPDNGSGAPGTFVTYATSGPMTLAEVQSTAGQQFAFPIALPLRPMGQPAPSFLQLNLEVASGGGTLTAGTIFAGLVLDRDDTYYAPSGFTPPPTVGAGT